MSLREKAEMLLDALLENAEQSVELATEVNDFLDDMVRQSESETTERRFLCRDLHMRPCCCCQSQTVYEDTAEMLETLVAAMGGYIVPADALEALVDAYIDQVGI